MSKATVIARADRRYVLLASPDEYPLDFMKMRVRDAYERASDAVRMAQRTWATCRYRVLVCDTTTGDVVFRRGVDGFADYPPPLPKIRPRPNRGPNWLWA